MKLYSIQEGEQLLRVARSAIELHVKTPKLDKEVMESQLSDFIDKHGVFVTIEHYPTKTLRGCIGFPYPVAPLRKLLVDAAVAAASEDSRFVPLSHMELEHIVIEINILAEPELIKAKGERELLNEIKIGRDGLILQYGFYSGLLLPLVPVEENWSKEEYLDNLCLKAGVPPHTWKGNAKIYKFTSQIFRELSPEGPIEEIITE